jgi:hypothetical protein
VPFFISALGDKQFKDLIAEDFEAVDLMLPDVPNRTGMPKEHTNSLYDRYAYAQKHGWDGLKRLSRSTLRNKYHTALNSFFDWLHTKRALPIEPIAFKFVLEHEY